MKKNIRSGFYDDGEVHGTENKKTSGFWRGVPGVTMIWHGEWSDPELEYQGKVANYWDIEDAMYEWATEDGVNVDSDEAFNKYCQEHDYDVYALFDNYPIESGCHGKSKKDDKKKKGKKSVKSAWGKTNYPGLDDEVADLQIDMTNTGYFEDGWLLITGENELGYRDGTEFTINAYGPNGEDLGSKKFDFLDLWHKGPIASSKKPVKSAMPGKEKYIQAVMEEYGCTREEAEEIIAEDIQSGRRPVKSGLMDKTKEEQVDQLYDKIWYDVDKALNEICFKYQEILGIHTGDSWEVLDPDTPTENIVAVLKDQLIHFVK